MRRLSIRARLGGAFLLVGLVSVAVAGVLIDHTVRQIEFDQVAERLRYEVTMTGQMTASALFAPLASDDTSLQGPIRELAASVHTHLSVLTADGAVAADSEREAGVQQGSDASEPEIVATLRDGKGMAVRGTGPQRRLWIAERIVRDGAVLGIARASVPLSIVDEQIGTVRRRVLWAALAALVLGSTIGLGLSLGISRPIRRLAETARSIGDGKLDVSSFEPPGDEIGELSQALCDMSRNLKQMVAKLDLRNADVRRVLDAVDEGLLMASMSGGIETERSARVDAWFDSPASGTPIWELFKNLDAVKRAHFQGGWEQLTDTFLPLELLIDQLPKRVVDGSRTYDLGYIPVLSGETCERVLVVIRDATLAAAAEIKEAEQRDLLAILGRAMVDRPGVADFLKEIDGRVAEISVEADPTEVYRHVHTIKGNSAIQGLVSVAALCHRIEGRIEQEGRIDQAGVDSLRSGWAAFRENVKVFSGSQDGVLVAETELDEVLGDLASGVPRQKIMERVASWTMTPIEASLSILGEKAKSLAERLGKGPLVVRVDHDGTRVDRERWAPLWAGLSHAVRNAIDHGLEAADERKQIGKNDAGAAPLERRGALRAADRVG